MKITYSEKPDYISYDDIHDLLWASNADNREKGFVLRTSELSGEMLQQRIGKDGYCFVAMDGEKLVGTLSIRFVERHTWYADGHIPDYILAGVLPEYRGKHINAELSNMVFQRIKELGYQIIELDTAEDNDYAINVYEHYGFKKVDFKPTKNGDHYRVVMAKWIDNCPFMVYTIKLRYVLKKIYIKSRYRENGKKRFGL